MDKKKIKYPMTKTVAMHYFKLLWRSILFICATIVYIYNKIHKTGDPFGSFDKNKVLMSVIWIFFIIGMTLRFFPAKIDSMGCQKQFAKNYKRKPEAPDSKRDMGLQSGVVTFAVFSAWIALNAIFGILYYSGVVDKGFLLLVCLAYSVCDVICILFFCPFQTWIMKNKCCTACRIYNWDYAMMFTPLIFIPNYYTWSLLGVALMLLIVWEIVYKVHPERFSESCNDSLSCANCQEKLCQHKRQLRSFLKKRNFNLKGNVLFKKKTKDNRQSADRDQEAQIK